MCYNSFIALRGKQEAEGAGGSFSPLKKRSRRSLCNRFFGVGWINLYLNSKRVHKRKIDALESEWARKFSMGIPPDMIWNKKYLKLEKGISVVFTPTKPFFDLGGRKSRGEKLLTSGEKLPIGGEKLPIQKGF